MPKDIQDWSPKEVGYSVAKKITNDGKYIDVGVDYNVEEIKKCNIINDRDPSLFDKMVIRIVVGYLFCGCVEDVVGR